MRLLVDGARESSPGFALTQQNAVAIAAQVALSRGDSGQARGFLREGERLSRETGDAFMLATNLNIQATLSQLQGDEDRTTAVLRESVTLSRALFAIAGRWSTALSAWRE